MKAKKISPTSFAIPIPVEDLRAAIFNAHDLDGIVSALRGIIAAAQDAQDAEVERRKFRQAALSTLAVCFPDVPRITLRRMVDGYARYTTDRAAALQMDISILQAILKCASA